MLLPLLLLVGCMESISIQVDTPPCENYDFDNPPEDGLEANLNEGDWQVYRVGVFQGCDDIFDPEVQGNGRSITVREYWVEQTEDDCELCFFPSIFIQDPASGVYEVEWYEGDATEPVDVLTFEVG